MAAEGDLGVELAVVAVLDVGAHRFLQKFGRVEKNEMWESRGGKFYVGRGLGSAAIA